MSQTLSALPIDLAIQVTRRRGARFELAVKDAANAAVDLTGDTLTCRVYDRYGGTQRLAGTVTITNAAAGLATLVFAAGDLDDGHTGAEVTTWVYAIERTHGGETAALFQGTFALWPATGLAGGGGIVPPP